MKIIFFLFFITSFIDLHYTQSKSDNIFLDSLKYISNMPYHCRDLESGVGIEPDCGDILFWEIIKNKLSIVEPLIELVSDTTISNAHVPYFGGNYSVGDIAYGAISEIIHGIPTFVLLGVEFDDKGCGYCSYWNHLRADNNNRVKFKLALKEWYNLNKDNLYWVEGDDFEICDCGKGHPNKGYYLVR